MILKNKNGADKIISVYWFVTLVIVSAGVFAMVYSFYGSPFDVRGVEARTMAEKIAECVSRQGILAPEILQAKENAKSVDLSDFCHLNFNSEFSDIQYFAQADFYDFKNFETGSGGNKAIITSKPLFTLSSGNANLAADCELQKTKNFEKQSMCSEDRIYAIDGKNGPYIVKILSVVRKTEKNAKI